MRKLMILFVLLALLVPAVSISAQDASGAGFVLTVAPAPIYVYDNGGQFTPSGGSILFCTALPVSGTAEGFAKLTDQGGWIPTTSYIYISQEMPVSERLSACIANAHG